MLKKRFFPLLVLSGILNAFLLALSLYFYLVKPSFQKPLPFTTSESLTTFHKKNGEMIEELEQLAYDKIILHLNEKDLLEDGYTKRDLALSMLVYKYQFDIGRSLKNKPLQMRKYPYKEKNLILFAGLKEQDFEEIRNFLQVEKFPFTTEGLFYRIKNIEECILPFIHSNEFIALETLFKRGGQTLKRKDLLELILEGDWEKFSSSYALLEKTGDFSEITRGKILLSYLEGGSRKAASLLLKTAPQFSYTRLSDEGILLLFSLSDQSSVEAKKFAMALAASKRSDAVIKAAMSLTEEARLNPHPGIGQLRPTFREQPPKSPPPRVHIIQKGETLSSIAHKYAIPQETLMQYNHLSSTALRAGQTLKLPTDSAK